MFERVEIIRGPASSLYGDSAFFAVVNVITRTGALLDGTALTLDGGNLGTRLARASTGYRLANGVDGAVSATYEATNGVGRLYFPAFDTPGTNRGMAQGLGVRLAPASSTVSSGAAPCTADRWLNKFTCPRKLHSGWGPTV
jgi:outer membrane cobalamin receptor